MTLCANCGEPEEKHSNIMKWCNPDPNCPTFFTPAPAPAPSEEGWLTDSLIDGWREWLRMTGRKEQWDQKHKNEADALCRMALAALAYREEERG